MNHIISYHIISNDLGLCPSTAIFQTIPRSERMSPAAGWLLSMQSSRWKRIESGEKVGPGSQMWSYGAPINGRKYIGNWGYNRTIVLIGVTTPFIIGRDPPCICWIFFFEIVHKPGKKREIFLVMLEMLQSPI